MNLRVNSGLILLALAVAMPPNLGVKPTLDHPTTYQSPRLMPPPSHLTPSPTPTPKPTPTPQPTSQSEQVFDLDEVYYFASGGGGEICGTWEGVKDKLPANARLPYVRTDPTIFTLRILCAYGFISNRDITVELYTPNKKRAATITDPATGGNSSNIGREVNFSMSYALPHGTWTVVVRRGNRVALNTFIHPPQDFPSIDATRILDSDVLHPFDPRWQMPYKRGDQVAVYGTGFRRNAEISLVVARSSGEFDPGKGAKYRPVAGWRVRTDSRGDFHVQFPIDRSFKEGDYAVLANPKSGRTFDPWTNDYFRVYSPWRACRNGPLSNLSEGDTARLSAGSPNNVRNRPRLNGQLVGKIQEYQRMKIVDGPRCSNGMTWWYVEVIDDGAENDGLKGWTAEGDASSYWVIPIGS